MHKRVVILGSTGSIGRSTLDVIAGLHEDVQVVGLAARRDWQRLAQQAVEFRVPTIALADEPHYAELEAAAPLGTRILVGPAGLVELVRSTDADFLVAAIVGAAGLPATLAAVEKGIDVGLANKESLVVAGAVIMPLAHRTGSRLIPIDSEHSAVFQCLRSGRPEEVQRIYLTASGGPFRTWPSERLEQATLADALNHPVWSMGPKITIDSATMMNKALEVIEAHYLFELAVEQIEVLVHPEAIVHSMVEFCDGSVIAQLGTPDMRTPIQYALTFPERRPARGQRLDWRQVRRLNFEPPDDRRFQALQLGFAAARRGGTSGAVLNAANEAAVERFRQGTIRFGQISTLAAHALESHRFLEQPTLPQLLECDAWAREEVCRCC